MTYSPYVGPALFLVLFLSAILPAMSKSSGADAPIKRSTLWITASGGVAAAAAQLALNLWIPWLGDGLLAGAVAILLFVTRSK